MAEGMSHQPLSFFNAIIMMLVHYKNTWTPEIMQSGAVGDLVRTFDCEKMDFVQDP